VNIGATGFQAKISRDGRTIVSDAKDSTGITSAAIWQGGVNWKTLGGVANGRAVDGVISSAWSVDGDGSAIAGLAWITGGKAHAFRWNAQDGMVDLGSLQGDSSRANAISANGKVIVGWDANPFPSDYPYWRGAVWTEGAERLMHPFGWIGQSEGTNRDGTIIVGHGHPKSYRHAVIFTAANGRIRDLGAIVRGSTPDERDQENMSIAFAVSDDGSVVVGSSGWMPPLDAFIWRKGMAKMVKLSDYLTEAGVAGFEKWQLVVANSISPGGKIIAGVGINPDGFAEGWIAELP
jgi:probable HAF family extracellular repeat protein